MVDLKVGDRVKVTHRPEYDREYPHDTVIARRANSGRSGTITDCSNARGLCFEVDTQSGKRAWFEPDELTPETLPDVIRAAHAEDVKTITGAALPPIGAKVRPKGGLHAGRTLRVMQHRGGEMLAEKGPWIGWYAPDAVEVLVTDPDGLPVEPAVPPVERRCGDGEHVRSITESAAALDRAATHWKRESSEAKQAIDGWVARCDTLRAELATEREARQAADVLARQLGEAANHAQIGEGAARMQLSRVAAAWDAYRTTSPLDTEACAKGLDRALAGVPAPVAPEEPTGLTPDDARAMARLFFAERDQEDGDEDALTGLLMRVSRGEKWTDRPVEAAAREEESTEYQVEIPRPAVPLGDAADLAALIAKVEADPLHNRGGVVSSALLVDVLRAVERRLVAVETRRPKVGPWTSPGMLHDAAGGTVASVWPSADGWGWVANRPNLGPLNGTAETEDEAKAAVLASLSSWCDVADAPEPREP